MPAFDLHQAGIGKCVRQSARERQREEPVASTHSSSTGRVKRPSRVDTSTRSAGRTPRMNCAVSRRTLASVSSGVTHRWVSAASSGRVTNGP